jgi:uncharacterized protein DUF1963
MLPMLSKAQVAQLARDCLLPRWAEDLVSTVSLGWALALAEGATVELGASRIGGLPDLAPGESWPLNDDGIPMTLMAQLDLSRLEPPTQDWSMDDASWSPPTGLMRVFADLLANPVDMCRATVLVCPPDAPLRPAPLLPLPDSFPFSIEQEQGYRSFPEIPVTLSPFLSAPETYRGIRSNVWDTGSGAPQDYQRWLDQLRVGEDGVEVKQALLGHPRSLHDDIRGAASLNFEEFAGPNAEPDLADPDQWRPFLSLFDDDDYGLEIADAGSFVVLAPARDIAAGRYDRLVCVPETC